MALYKYLIIIIIMSSAQVVETSVNVITNSPFQDYTHPDNHTLPTCDILCGLGFEEV